MYKIIWLHNKDSPFGIGNNRINDIINQLNLSYKDCEIIWLKDYNEFEDYINSNGLPFLIIFNSILSQDKTGFDCARFLVRYCMNYYLPLPRYNFGEDNKTFNTSIHIVLERYIEYYYKLTDMVNKNKVQTLIDSNNDLPF